MEEKRSLFICGDIHGELKYLVYNVIQCKWGLKNSDIIVVGDFGAGFGRKHSMQVNYEKIEKRLEKDNNVIWALRGNHDDPAFFDGTHDFPRLHFLKDHEIVEICGKKIYPIGGATSVDIDAPDRKGRTRRWYNDRYIRLGSSQRCWWPDENIVPSKDPHPTKVDIILSHEAPFAFEPVPIRPNDCTNETWDRVLADRRYLDEVLYETNASWWIYGHYHTRFSGHIGDLMYRCLPELELFEIR
jgi:DNA repair exonuclease SbcCD nuclease subunit